MERQRMGLVVLLLALVIAVVVPNLTPHRIAGSATLAPPPAPPGVGDCVLEPFAVGSEYIATAKGVTPIYPRPATGPCRGTVYGQVSAVMDHPIPIVEPLYNALQDPNSANCPSNGALEDLPPGSDAGTAYGHWHVQLSTETVVISPTPRQSTAGQKWVACVITVSRTPSATTNPSLIGGARGFDAPINAWRHSRQVAAAVGRCLLVDYSSFDVSDCSTTHAAESFGDTTGPFTPEMATSCRKLVDDLTAMTDPTAGGRLTVEVISDDANGNPVTSAADRGRSDANQTCVVHGDKHTFLKGSLLALGSDPVPFGS